MRRRLLTVVFVLCFLLVPTMVFAQVANPDWWKKAAEPYKGVVIHGVSESTPPSKAIAEIAVPAFEELTGIKVELETTSWDEMYNKEIQDMQAGAGIYDFVYLEQDAVCYIEQDWLTDLTPFVDNADLTEPDF